MNYYQELALNLRHRGCEEDQVLAVLEEAKEATETAGTTPKAAFGKPDAVAERYSGERTPLLGRSVLNVFRLLGLCCVAIYAIWPEFFGFTNPVLEKFAGVLAMLVMLAIGSLAVAFIDSRLPRGFSLKGSTADDLR